MSSDQPQYEAYAKQYGQLVAKAWADESFKQRLLADPAAVFKEEGLVVPEGVELRAVENTDKVLYLTLPPKPTEELSDEQLSQVAGGSSASTVGTTGSASTFATATTTVSSFGSALCLGCAGTAG